MKNPIDNRVHFSELKQMARSPAHYHQACLDAREVTRPMRVGAVTDCMVFGDRGYALYPGKVRQGAEWDAFAAAHAGEITCIKSEWDDAAGASRAVLAHPLARQLLVGGTYQLALQWEAYGLPMAAGINGVRGGIDLLGVGCDLTEGEPFVADLKVTDTEPSTFARHAWRMLWHAQLAAYLDACEALDIPARRAYLIGVEPAPPHAVTILPVSAAALDSGRRSLHRWAEMVRQCTASGVWPGYLDRMAEPLEVPEWERDEPCSR